MELAVIFLNDLHNGCLVVSKKGGFTKIYNIVTWCPNYFDMNKDAQSKSLVVFRSSTPVVQIWVWRGYSNTSQCTTPSPCNYMHWFKFCILTFVGIIHMTSLIALAYKRNTLITKPCGLQSEENGHNNSVF